MKVRYAVVCSLALLLVGQDSCEDADSDGDGWTVSDGDCNDNDAETHPGAEEICDNRDNNCDGEKDEGVTTTYYADLDADGYGDPTTGVEACSAPTGYVTVGGDCDDTDASVSPETNCAYDVGGSSCADIFDLGLSLGDGLYQITPSTGEPVTVYCDMSTADVGWTRVFSIALGTGCTMDTGATSQDPADDGQSCAKYSDELINALSSEKVFYSRIDDYDPLYTHYSDSISADTTPGTVVQAGSYEEALSQEPTYEIGYGSWVLFHQQNWYTSDRCLGAPEESYRLSLEYVSGPATCESCNKYACTGDCSTDCPSHKYSGQAEVYIR